MLPDGRLLWVALHAAVARDPDGTPLHFVAHIVDVTEHPRAAAMEARFAALVEHGSDLIAVTDADGRLVYASPSYRTVLGFDPDAHLGELLLGRVHPDDQEAVWALGAALLATPGASGSMDFRFAHADGSWRWVEATLSNRLDVASVMGFVINTRDVTERVEAAARLAHQATHDELTGLPNRAALADGLAGARRRAGGDGAEVAVLFVDVDHFKEVNDLLGHRAGDRLLQDVAARLRGAARVEDQVFRLGGDEFLDGGRPPRPGGGR